MPTTQSKNQPVLYFDIIAEITSFLKPEEIVRFRTINTVFRDVYICTIKSRIDTDDSLSCVSYLLQAYSCILGKGSYEVLPYMLLLPGTRFDHIAGNKLDVCITQISNKIILTSASTESLLKYTHRQLYHDTNEFLINIHTVKFFINQTTGFGWAIDWFGQRYIRVMHYQLSPNKHIFIAGCHSVTRDDSYVIFLGEHSPRKSITDYGKCVLLHEDKKCIHLHDSIYIVSDYSIIRKVMIQN